MTQQKTKNVRASVETTGERIRVVMTIEQIANRLTTLKALGAATIVASLGNGAALSLVCGRLRGYVVALEDGKMKAREVEVRELCEDVISLEGRAA